MAPCRRAGRSGSIALLLLLLYTCLVNVGHAQLEECVAITRTAGCLPPKNASTSEAAIAKACQTLYDEQTIECTPIQVGGLYADCTPYERLTWVYGTLYQYSLQTYVVFMYSSSGEKQDICVEGVSPCP